MKGSNAAEIGKRVYRFVLTDSYPGYELITYKIHRVRRDGVLEVLRVGPKRGRQTETIHATWLRTSKEEALEHALLMLRMRYDGACERLQRAAEENGLNAKLIQQVLAGADFRNGPVELRVFTEEALSKIKGQQP